MNSNPPHHPRYFCTCCDDLLTAKSSRKKADVQKHITNADDAAHHGRSGNSVSAPIIYTGTDSNVIEPIWKTASETKTEQRIFLALLQYPHLSISKNNKSKGDSVSLTELLSVEKRRIARCLFNNPQMLQLWIRLKYEYIADDGSRPPAKVTTDPLERLLHQRLIALVIAETDCSINRDGSLDVPSISSEKLTTEFNSTEHSPIRPETGIVDSDATLSQAEAKQIVTDTVIEPRLPSHRNQVEMIVALATHENVVKVAEVATERSDHEVTRHMVYNLKRYFPWEIYDIDALQKLKYNTEEVAEDFYNVLKSANLTPTAWVEEHHPESTQSKTHSEDEIEAPEEAQKPGTATEQPQSVKADGGVKPDPAGQPNNQQLCLTLTSAPTGTLDHVTTLVETALTAAKLDTPESDAALTIYEQLPKSTREAILTDVRTDTSDEIFGALAVRL